MPGPDEVNAIRQGPRLSRKALELDPGQEPLFKPMCKTLAKGPVCRTQAWGPCAGPMLASQGPMCKLLLLCCCCYPQAGTRDSASFSTL